MITPKYIETMARYNAWQNRSIYLAASGLSEEERQQDRGVFFKSIHATLTHLLWGDTVWMSRFDNWDAPEINIPNSVNFAGDWGDLAEKRHTADNLFLAWAGRVTADNLTGNLTWYSGALQKDVTKPRTLCITHMFNHQTHHRGQVNAMLTVAGAKLDDTDLFIMPDGA